MGYYKIQSLTNTLPKRDMNKNLVLDIEYKEGFSEKKYSLKPGGILYLASATLPIKLHQLRMKKLIIVSEISKNNFMKLQNPAPKVATTSTTKAEKKEETSKKGRGRKKEETSVVTTEE